MFKKILMPVDFSQDIEKLSKILRKIEAEEVILVHVIDETEISLYQEIISAMTSTPPPEKKEPSDSILYKKSVEKIQDCEKKLADAGFKVKSIIEIGVPYKKVLEITEKNGVELIVIPAIGKRLSLLKEVLLLGGTATRIVRHSKVPVLIIK